MVVILASLDIHSGRRQIRGRCGGGRELRRLGKAESRGKEPKLHKDLLSSTYLVFGLRVDSSQRSTLTDSLGCHKCRLDVRWHIDDIIHPFPKDRVNAQQTQSQDR